MIPFLRKNFILLSLLLLIPYIGTAQWVPKNISLTGNFNDIAGFQESNLILATDNGLYHTSNGAALNPTWTNTTLIDPTENMYFQNVEFLQFELYNVTSNTNALYSSLGFNSITNEYSVYLIDSFNPRNAQRIWTSQPNQTINALAKSNSRNEEIVILGDNGFALQYKNGVFYTLDNRINGNLKSGSLGGILLILDDENNKVFVLNEDFSTGQYLFDYVKFLPIGNYNCTLSQGSRNFILGDSVIYFNNSPSADINVMDKHFDTMSIKTLIDGNIMLAASDIGIYYTSNPLYYFERQVSTINQHITNGSVIGQTDIYYAVGPNQTILRSNNISGDQLELYGKINPYPACTNNSGSGASMVKGSANSRSWFVNGVQIFNNNINYTYDGSSNYLLELVLGGANGSQATFTYNQIPSDVPNISMNITSNQSNYCNGDRAIITIDNSESNVIYKLKSGSGSNEAVWGEAIGNGSTITIDFQPTRATENYYVTAKNPVSLCESGNSSILTIDVLRTEADFSFNMLNVYPNETIPIYNQSTFTDTYSWDFGPNASPSTSSLENPFVSYTTATTDEIDLTATHNTGCSSTKLLEAPLIVTPPAVTPYWNLESGISTGTNNVSGFTDLLRNIYDTGDGIIMYGRHDDLELKTRAGQSKYVPDGLTDQVYLAKYDYLGTLKFVVYGTSNGDLMITDVVTDNNDNIILSFWGDSTLDFIDAKKNQYSFNNRRGNHLAKLNKYGEFLEAFHAPDMTIYDLTINDQNEIFIIADLSGTSDLIINDWETNNTIDSRSTQSGGISFKLDSNYNILWINNWIGGANVNMTLDSSGNIIYYGSYASDLSVVSNSGASYFIGNRFSWRNTVSRYDSIGYIIKMDSSGNNFLWNRSFVSLNNNSSNNTNWPSDSARVLSVALDSADNIYTCIRNSRWRNGNFLRFDLETMNRNQFLSTTNLGTLVYKKFDSNGNELWNTGTEQTNDAIDVRNVHLTFENNFLVSTYLIDSLDDTTAPQTTYYSPTANPLTLFTNYPEDLAVREFRDTNGDMQFIKPITTNASTNGNPAITLLKLANPITNFNNDLFIGVEMRNPWSTAVYNNEIIMPKDTRIMLSKVDDSTLPSIFPDNTAGIASIEENGLSLYPNPAKNSVQINFSKESILEIGIYSISGQIVKKIKISSSDNVDVSQLKPGLYILKSVDKKSESFFSKLIIK